MTTFPAQPYRDYLKEEYMKMTTKTHTCDGYACDVYPATLCPLHAATPRLAEALKRLADHFEGSVAALPEFGYGRAIIADARAALEEAGL